jgi:hypothetical protein
LIDCGASMLEDLSNETVADEIEPLLL